MISADFPDVVALAYLDDIVLIGTQEDTQLAYERLIEYLSTAGLTVNRHKSKVLLHHGVFEADISLEASGLKILGVPIGKEEFIREHLRNLLELQTRVLAYIPLFPSYQQFPLLRSCINARPFYLARCLHPAVSRPYFMDFDSRIDTALSRLVGTHAAYEWTSLLRHLPPRHGGIGLRRLSRIQEAAYTSSWLSSMKYLYEVIGGTVQDLIRTHSTFDYDIIARQLHLVQEGPVDQQREFLTHIVPLFENRIPTQSELVCGMDVSIFEEVKTILLLPTADNRLLEFKRDSRVWLESAAVEGIHSWIHNTFTLNLNPALRVDHRVFQNAMRTRLLIPTVEGVPLPGGVCRCGREWNQYHAFTCERYLYSRTYAHNTIVRELAAFITRVSGGSVGVEMEVARYGSKEGRYCCL
jgi:hypothetical protein